MTLAPRLLLALSSAAGVFAIPRATAEACSAPDCWPGSLVPAGTGARIPANLPAAAWRPIKSNDGLGTPPDPARVELVEVGGEQTAIPLVATERDYFEYELELGAALTVGSTYRLADRSTCEISGEPGPEIVFEAVESAPLPEPSDSLGTLRVTPEGIGSIEVATGRGSCSSFVEGDRILFELEPSAAAAPWLAALAFETLVDGAPWGASPDINVVTPIGASWAGRGRDRIYLPCSSDDPTVLGSGIPAGRHVVAMRARLPGTDVSITTPEVELTLSCRDQGPGETTMPPGDESDADEDGGCLAGRRSSGVPGVAAITLLLGATSARRRRRS